MIRLSYINFLILVGYRNLASRLGKRSKKARAKGSTFFLLCLKLNFYDSLEIEASIRDFFGSSVQGFCRSIAHTISSPFLQLSLQPQERVRNEPP